MSTFICSQKYPYPKELFIYFILFFKNNYLVSLIHSYSRFSFSNSLFCFLSALSLFFPTSTRLSDSFYWEQDFNSSKLYFYFLIELYKLFLPFKLFSSSYSLLLLTIWFVFSLFCMVLKTGLGREPEKGVVLVLVVRPGSDRWSNR